jgi:mono/diheme cytochrome c family protein
VISYNDAAGRFEFQIVRDYQVGKTPQIFYARRSLCLACHQNAAPIFARPLWDETPANPAIAARLKTARRDFYQVKLTGTDIAYFIDAATDRANLFSVWQTLWQQGCGVGAAGDRCRMEAFAAALDYARSGKLPAPASLATLDRNWTSLWLRGSSGLPGLPIPNPDLPNRDPLAALADPANDPLLLRAPLEVWKVPDKTAFVVGLAGMLDPNAVRLLARRDLGAALDTLRARGELVARPFSHALLDALLVELGLPGKTASARLPPARVESRPLEDSRFRAHCGVCHDSAANEPPNFLHGDTASVNARLDHCAERIFYRLSMAKTAVARRGKSPMPPSAMLAARGLDAETWARSPDLEALLQDMRLRLRSQGGSPEALLARPYAQLRACLPMLSPHDKRP